MAHPRGFEPLASAFGGQRSIQLSYGCLWRSVSRRSGIAPSFFWAVPLFYQGHGSTAGIAYHCALRVAR